MNKKGKGGRPKMAPENIRHKSLSIRLNATELGEVLRKADSSGLPPTVWLRRAALSRMVPRPPVPELNRAAYAELARLAGNLNQLTRAAHEGRIAIAPEFINKIREAVQELRLGLLGAERDSESD